jgi:hypothetical protein
MRSGSTLFRLILDAHPRIAIGEETGFMAALAATRRIPHWRHGEGWFERIGWRADEMDDRLRDFYAGMFERYAASQGKQRWGEKTPFHSTHMAQMATIFPDAVFAAIVRHPGAVVNSMVRKFHYSLPDAATYWDSTNREILRRGLELGPGRFALLRYEDLVENTEPALRELVDWLGEPWSDALLRHNDVQASRGAPRLSNGNIRTRDPINPELADRWAEALDDTDRDVLLARTGELAAFLGYDAARPGTAGPLFGDEPAGRRFLLTGAELARRQDGPTALVLDTPEDVVVMPEGDPVELAKRLKTVEAALARMRGRRAVRWSASLRRAQRRLTGIPVELRNAAGDAFRRRGPRR